MRKPWAVADVRYTRDLYGSSTEAEQEAGAALLTATHGIQTHYEARYRALGKPIHYLEFRFN